MWSDVCAAQFRSCFVFKLLANYRRDLQLEWNYSDAHYSKCPRDVIGAAIKNAVFRQVKSGRVIANSAEEFSVAAYESVSSIATLFQKEKICSASQMTSPSTPETLQIHKFVWSSTAEGGRIIALCFLSNGKESSHTQSYLERTCSHVVKEYVTSALFLLLCANCMKKYLEQNEAEDGFMKSASNCSHYVI